MLEDAPVETELVGYTSPISSGSGTFLNLDADALRFKARNARATERNIIVGCRGRFEDCGSPG